MTAEDMKKILSSTGLPVAYRAFQEGEAPSLPFICFLVPGSNNFAADGCVYFKANRVQIELYTKYKDLESEGKVEEALSSFFWEKTEEYIESEKCFQIVYELEV